MCVQVQEPEHESQQHIEEAIRAAQEQDDIDFIKGDAGSLAALVDVLLDVSHDMLHVLPDNRPEQPLSMQGRHLAAFLEVVLLMALEVGAFVPPTREEVLCTTKIYIAGEEKPACCKRVYTLHEEKECSIRDCEGNRIEVPADGYLGKLCTSKAYLHWQHHKTMMSAVMLIFFSKIKDPRLVLVLWAWATWARIVHYYGVTTKEEAKILGDHQFCFLNRYAI